MTPDDTLQATVATDLGTLDIQDNTGNLVLAYTNNWAGDASVTFSGSQDDINAALATATLVTDGTTGTAHVSLTASVAQPELQLPRAQPALLRVRAGHGHQLDRR